MNRQKCSSVQTKTKLLVVKQRNAPEVVMAKWKLCLVVMMVEVLDVILGGVEGLPF